MSAERDTRWQEKLETFYQRHPFELVASMDATRSNLPHICRCCGNKRVRYLFILVDRDGNRWQVGNECETALMNRQRKEHDQRHRDGKVVYEHKPGVS